MVRVDQDTMILRQITNALTEVGSQLDAADRMRGHSPWSAIGRQEAEIKRLARGLSDRFCMAHPGLVEQLRSCRNLHLAWGALRDEVEQAMQRGSDPEVVWITSRDAEMQAAIEQAQGSLADFLGMLACPREGQSCFGIKARFPIPGAPGEHEHIWLSDVRHTGEGLSGRIANDPQLIADLHVKDEVVVRIEDVTDWMVIEKGTLLGGFPASLPTAPSLPHPGAAPGCVPVPRRP